MRCAQFQPLVKRTNKEATSPTSPLQQHHHHHQPSNNLTSILEGAVYATSACSLSSHKTSTMIRRSQRETAKNQSNGKSLSVVSSPTPRSSTASVKNQAYKLSQKTSSASSLKTQHLQAPSSKSEGTLQKPGSGRHPHPPSANNTKLKHKCPFDGCPWKFATPYKLRRHIKSHTKETPYLCKECGRGFSVRYNLLMHIQTIHSQPQKYKCPIRGCKDAFHSQSRLNGHLRRIHKKDWKTLSKDLSAKTSNSRGSSTSSSDSLDLITPTGATPTTGMRKLRLSSVPHKCPHCAEEFSSKTKLASHVKIHTSNKNFMCDVQNCGKWFVSQDKLSRHAEMHRNSKQFCCPHKNCNRIFLRQTHLRNHLKIHTQDHQFVCPVLDCSQKFASEGAYNVHLNTHINYGYSCPHPNCEFSFLSRKRLAIHTQVVHNMYINPETGISSPLLDGIQPHLGISTLNSPSSPPSLLPLSITDHCHSQHSSSSSSSSSFKSTPISRRVIDNDFIKNIDLPGLSVNDIEAVLSENEDWSGEQIDQFLRSAVDLSEIESKLFSLASYESDSGYSTYDVSPLTSTAPANLNYTVSQVSCPPPLTLVNHATSPLFNNPSFPPGMPMPPHHSPSLIHDTTVSPCASDIGFFSPHSGFNSLASTPNQESMTFFPAARSPASLYSKSFTQPPQDYNIFSIGNACFSDISAPSAIPSFSLQIPDILLHDVNVNHMPNSMAPLSSGGCANTKFLSCSQEVHTVSGVGNKLEAFSDESQSKKDVFTVKIEGESEGLCAFEGHNSPLDLSLLQSTPPAVQSLQAGEESKSKANLKILASKRLPERRYSAGTRNSSSESPHKRKGKGGLSKVGGSSSLKGRKKTQWPKSMNRANLIAFREHILNKLKNGQETAVNSPLEAVPSQTFSSANEVPSPNASKATTAPPSLMSPSSSSPPLIKCEASSLNSLFELQVKYERNHVIPERCHSEPADLQSYVLHSSSSSSCIIHQQSSSKSDTNINGGDLEDMKLLDVTGRECDDLLSALSFNPDTLLSSSQADEKMLDDFGFKFEGEVGGIEIADFLVSSDRMTEQHHHQPLATSLEDVDAMNIDSIQELLDYSEDPSVSSSSPYLFSSQRSPLESSSTVKSLSRSSSLYSMENVSTQCGSSGSCGSPRDKENIEAVPFKFPEIFSVQGSMVLDGVDVSSDSGMESGYSVEQPFLHPHHDPLLADSRNGGASNLVKNFDI